MIIFPAIDIKNGKCVRLIQGDAAKKTEYGDPVEVAGKWQEAGSEWLHIVDLDGALGEGDNLGIIGRIKAETGMRIQVGGGMRTLEQIEARINIGAERVIIGTAAVKDREVVKKAAYAYPGRIIIGVDAKDGYVRTEGWIEGAGVTPEELINEMSAYGIDTFIYTDISRDGLMGGPDIKGTAALCASGKKIIGSGGVSTMEHIAGLNEAGCYGVIIGKAIYEGKLDIKQAIEYGKANKA